MNCTWILIERSKRILFFFFFGYELTYSLFTVILDE